MKHYIVKENGEEVSIGQRILTFRGELVEVVDFTVPSHSSSIGRIYIKSADGQSREVFPSVVGCKIVSNLNK